MQRSWLSLLQRLATFGALAAAVVTLVGWWGKGTLPDPSALQAVLRRAPVQRDTRRAPFEFRHAGETYRVRPRAEYELWGLVVSQNDPEGLGDIYHDERSVDTRDLCVIFGDNVTRPDYQRVSFSSGSWTCRYEYPAGVTFQMDGIANNHLITNDDAIRAQTKRIHVGDQVHAVGQLVDYQAASNPSFWRRTSLTRRDDGQGACEVLFLTHLEVLARGTPALYAAYDGGWRALAALVAGKLLLFVLGVVLRF